MACHRHCCDSWVPALSLLWGCPVRLQPPSGAGSFSWVPALQTASKGELYSVNFTLTPSHVCQPSFPLFLGLWRILLRDKCVLLLFIFSCFFYLNASGLWFLFRVVCCVLLNKFCSQPTIICCIPSRISSTHLP